MDRKTKEALGTTALAGATAGVFGAAALGANAAGTERRNRRQAKERDEQRVQARKEKTSQGRNQARKAAAETRLTQLQRIKPSDLSPENRKVRTAYIKEQKNILKDLKPKTAASIAKSIGLKSIPGIGAFLTAFSSTPAYYHGGKVHRGRSAQGNKG